MHPGIDLLANLPQLAAIGQQQLALYCAEWLATPLAREFAVVGIDISDDLRFNVLINLQHKTEDGETLIVPFDEMLHYIVDRHFGDSDERRSLHEQIDLLRRGKGEAGRVFQADLGPAFPTYLVCKNSGCQNLMQTQYTAYVGERLTGDAANVTCPRCQHTYLYSATDLQFLVSPG